MSLPVAKIRSIKPPDKPFKLTDSHGLYQLVNSDKFRNVVERLFGALKELRRVATRYEKQQETIL
ncbi:hypothetical protein AC791_14150 [Klebsiella sp. RIT-PI-d]|uniref:transposase n=1 Tax=Klebsiella sp. RIT-PI-d TaxID=1681196 RepID=UPI0006763584|nr:hypothetical protein AC791_14150 [Klebsiella sp. RIT-PI-d]